MLNIEFGIKSLMKFPRLEKKFRWRVEFPTVWNELKERDLVYLGSKYPYSASLKSHYDFFNHLCNLKSRRGFAFFSALYLKNDAQAKYAAISGDHIEKMEDWPLQWVFGEPDGDKTIIETVTVGKIQYHTFTDGLRDISIEEFAQCEKFLNHIITNQSFEALENLVAVLFQQKGIPFDEDKCFARAKLFEQLPQALKIAIYIQYRAQRKFMIDCNPAMFRKRKTETLAPVKSNWEDIILDVATDFINEEEVKKRKAWAVFRWIAYSNKRAKEMKQRLKEQKK